MREHLAQHYDEEESEINITPMLDVVFIMLIFFIVTATFVKEAGIEVNRPDAATAVKWIFALSGRTSSVCTPRTPRVQS